MTTLTIDKKVLEQALNALLLPCDRWNGKQFLIVNAAVNSVQNALSAPATAPEKTVKEIMEFARHYAADTFSSATLEDKIRRSLAAPATAPDEQVRRDAERVAWYENNPEKVLNIGFRWFSRNGYGLPMKRRKGFREAIDAAMKETP